MAKKPKRATDAITMATSAAAARQARSRVGTMLVMVLAPEPAAR